MYVFGILKRLFVKSHNNKTNKTIFDATYKRVNPWQIINSITANIDQIVGNYQSAREDLSRYERTIQDILHALELAKNEVDERELMLLTKELINLRKQRRRAKNFIELATPIYRVLEEYPCIKKEFKQATSEVKKIREKHQLRKYKLRELKHISYMFSSENQNHSKISS